VQVKLGDVCLLPRTGSPTFLKLRVTSWVLIYAKSFQLLHASEIKKLLNLSVIMLHIIKSVIFVHVKKLIMLMLLSEQTRRQLTCFVWATWFLAGTRQTLA